MKKGEFLTRRTLYPVPSVFSELLLTIYVWMWLFWTSAFGVALLLPKWILSIWCDITVLIRYSIYCTASAWGYNSRKKNLVSNKVSGKKIYRNVGNFLWLTFWTIFLVYITIYYLFTITAINLVIIFLTNKH